jgi:MFS family permease
VPVRPVLHALRGSVRESVSGLPSQFWWLWTSMLVNQLGGFVVTFLALYLTVHRGYSASYAGLVGGLYGLGGAVSSVCGGVLADRVGRRPTLLGAQVATAAATVVLGLVHGPVAIAVTACALGAAGNASRPPRQAIMADVVAPLDRARAFSLNYWGMNVGFAVAAAIAGLIASHGYLLLFLGDAATTLLCAFLVFLRVPETRPARPGGADPAPGPRHGLGTVLRDRAFMAVVGLSFLAATVFQQGATTLSVDMGRHGVSSTQYGLLAALNGLLIVLLQLPVTRLTRGRSPAGLLVVASLLCGWGFGITAFAGPMAVYVLAVSVWTLGEIVYAPTAMGLVADMAPRHVRGRYQGMYNLSWSAAAFTAPLCGGLVLDHLGGGVLWGASAALGTVAALGFGSLLGGPRHAPAPRDLPAPAPEEAV